MPRSGRPTKRVLEVVESTMQNDDKTTAREIVVKLQGLGLSLSKNMVLKTDIDSWDGQIVDLHTASLSEMSTSKKVQNGL